MAGTRTSSQDEVRRHNLSSLLTLVHSTGHINRSQLSKHTGLNRSTIGTLVGELVELGLAIETAPDKTNAVGRPSAVVEPDPRVAAISISPEVDAVTITLVGLNGRVAHSEVYETMREPTVTDVVNFACDFIDKIRLDTANQYRLAGVGVVVPGLVRQADQLIIYAPQLKWRNEPLVPLIERATGLPTVVANDAHTGALAELTFGVGAGVSNLVYLNGGAGGIGAGIIIAGQLVEGASGYAGEIGHTRISTSGMMDTAGFTGTLEAHVSRERLTRLMSPTRVSPEMLEPVLFAKESSDVKVQIEMQRQEEHLGAALSNIINMLNPQVIVLGGFLEAVYKAGRSSLMAWVERGSLSNPLSDVTIVSPTLGSNILAVGAAELAFKALIEDPANTQLIGIP